MEKKNKVASLLLSIACVSACLVAGAVALARAAETPAPQTLKKVVIAYSAISPSQSPAWVTYEAGLFRKYGLDVQLIFVESGSRTVQTLISGDVVAAQVGGTSAIQSNLKNSGVVMIGGFLNTMDYKFIVARDITRPDQLKGKTVAVSRIGSSSDFATRYMLEKYGLVPDKDVSFLQIGSQPARFSALETEKIHGTMIAIPLTAKAAKMGFNTMADLQMLGLEYQHTGLAVTQNTIESQPDLVRNVLKAFVEGIHYMKTHRKETRAILSKYLKTDDPEALDESYESVVQALIPQKPYPTLKGIQIVLRRLGIKDPTARAARPEQFVDMTFMNELDRTGFIDGLYKSTAVAKVVPRAEPEATPVPPPAPAKEKAAPPESKVKAVAVASIDEKPKPISKQLPLATEKPAVPKVASPVTPAAEEYVITQGDTLSKLAGRFYNAVSKWPKIYEANRDTVRNPNYIFIGQRIIIPPDV